MAGTPSIGGGESGASSIASVFGVAIFLGFLLMATQVMVHMYASSTTSAIAFDEARRASGLHGLSSCDDTAAQQQISNRVRNRLGSWANDTGEVSINVGCDTAAAGGTAVVVEVAGPSPARTLSIFGGGVGLDRIERSARFIRETDGSGA